MRVAIVGVWHVHVSAYTKTAKELGEVVGVYDDNEAWKTEFAEEHNIKAFSSYDELLKSDIEGVIICTSTNKHKDFILKAANAKKHIFTEKVLTLDTESCYEIRDAVIENGVKFVIAFPWRCAPAIRAAKKAVDDGEIGKINYVRFRNCHDGSLSHFLPAHFYNREECGGGAMIDLGAHGMYITHWLLGEPDSYSSTFNHFCRDEKDAVLNPDGVEDNAITVMSYKNGAIAVNETGFVSVGSPTTLEVGGELGYICFKDNKTLLRNRDGVKELSLPQDTDRPITAFMKGNSIEGCGIEEAIALTKMMVGAYGN